MTAKQDPIPIRDFIRRMIEERDDSIRSAERAMGMSRDTLGKFLRGSTLTLATESVTRLASYLGIPERAVGSWISRDYERACRVRRRPRALVRDGGLTLWGPMRKRVEGNCRTCEAAAACRAEVAAGRPLPCEGFLEREMVEPGMEYRGGRLGTIMDLIATAQEVEHGGRDRGGEDSGDEYVAPDPICA